jgi:hypothetical protein
LVISDRGPVIANGHTVGAIKGSDRATESQLDAVFVQSILVEDGLRDRLLGAEYRCLRQGGTLIGRVRLFTEEPDWTLKSVFTQRDGGTSPRFPGADNDNSGIGHGTQPTFIRTLPASILTGYVFRFTHTGAPFASPVL